MIIPPSKVVNPVERTNPLATEAATVAIDPVMEAEQPQVSTHSFPASCEQGASSLEASLSLVLIWKERERTQTDTAW